MSEIKAQRMGRAIKRVKSRNIRYTTEVKSAMFYGQCHV